MTDDRFHYADTTCPREVEWWVSGKHYSKGAGK